MDRRVEKTRKAIFEAFTGLLKRKNFESITVSELADAADINRVTIYKHFSDIYDVLDQCIASNLSPFLADCGSDTMEKLTLNAFEYLYQNRATLNLLFKAAGPGALHEKVADAFKERNNHIRAIANSDNPLYTELKTQYLISALAGVFEWWLTAPDGYSVNEVCDTFLNILDEFFPEYHSSGIN